MQSKHFYGFGPFRLDLARRLLSRHGEPIPLTSKGLDTLAVLVQNRGRVVSKEELMHAVWPDTVVEDGNLTQHISTLRKVLGESPTEHAYIETIPKQGYRFVAEVTEAAADAGLKLSRARWAIAILAVLGIAGSTLWILNGRTQSRVSVLATSPFTSDLGVEQQPSFSPEGNQIAFAWNGEKQDNFDIYVKLIGAGKPLRLTSNPGRDFRPAWSPDGRFIAFLRDIGGGKTALIVIPAIGGSELMLAEAGSSPFAVFEPYLEWTPDNKWLATRDHSFPGEPLGLFLVSVETGEKRRLTSPLPHGMGDTHAAFSPDGRTLAFIRQHSGSRLCLVTLSSGFTPAGEPKCFTLGDHWLSRLVWTADGRDIIFSAPSGARGRPSLWRTVVFGPGGRPSTPQRLPTIGESSGDHAISRDGHRLAYSSLLHNSSVWRLKLPHGDKEIGGGTDRPFELISSTRLDANARYSPDGNRIVFWSTRSGRPAIWVCANDGSDAVQLTSFKAMMTGSPRWSPDGQRIVFDSNVEGLSEIYVMQRDGGRLRRLTHHPATDAVPSWSRDGRWIYFGSTRSGEPQVWKILAEGGDAVQQTRRGGFIAFDSPDGDFVYYAKSGGMSSLWRVPAGGGEEVKVIDSAIGFSFTVTDRGIYFVAPAESGHAIHLFNFGTSQITRVAQVEGPLANGLSLSPDGRFLLYSRYELRGSDLMLVSDFR